MTGNSHLLEWVKAVERTARPDRVHWCDGSEAEAHRLAESMLRDGTLIGLNEAKFPGCYLHRSHPSDVARTEHLTFICSDTKEEAGPTNNWMAPAEARERVWKLYDGAMRGRTLYVVPYVMGPLGSPLSKVGVEITDSPYVALSMRIMTRMGSAALAQLGNSPDFVKGLHSLGDLSPERRFICHFPSAREIWSVGSGYGGNALLGKKCFALRIASVQARDEGWFAEHMLILGVEAPDGQVTYVAAAFPSACGKTNLAMLVPPASQKGWRVFTVGDDICWMRPGPDGRLWAINPEAGFFGVAPGTGAKTNPNALATVQRNSIFTNTAMTEDRCPWWEGLDPEPPERLIDWRGEPWRRGSAEKAAHPNSRFTAPASQCPSISPRWEDPAGVPISALVFGGRRARTFPLVFQSYDWKHGVFVGAGTGSETTAAQSGAVGVVRRDPMAMLPFCGYNMADYFGHWLSMESRIRKPPAIFHVNWFRQDAGGTFLWPGFGENLRVLQWIIARAAGGGAAVESPIGHLPARGAIDTTGLEISDAAMTELLTVDRGDWEKETDSIAAFFGSLGGRLPAEMRSQLAGLRARMGIA